MTQKSGNDLPTEHPFQRDANDILEAMSRKNWESVLRITRILIHKSLGFGYFSFAVTLKKLFWSLVPVVDETAVQKYVLRILWLLARVKRENDSALLIRRISNFFQLQISGHATKTYRRHNNDSDLKIPSLQEVEIASPHLAGLFEQIVVSFSICADQQMHHLHDATHHEIIPSPHVKFAGVPAKTLECK
ncbi:MAG: hypothetical protein FWC50_09850 [Planctomycetaceae bacterium]|nr:hypothetical protein [Planctomycetaceae bacterium]